MTFLLWVLVLVSYLQVNSFTPDDCFLNLLKKTQSCDNMNIYYGSMVGGKLGIGVEFTVRLMRQVLCAVMNNQRFVFVNAQKKWEYNCASGEGWACYINFGCDDSIVRQHQVNLMNKGSAADPCTSQPSNPLLCRGSIFEGRLIEEYIDMKREFVFRNLQQLHDELTRTGKNQHMEKGVCNLENSSYANISTIIGSHVYRLNTATKTIIDTAIKERFPQLLSPTLKQYVALQIRLTDKKREVTPDVWNWMNNATNIANFVTPLLQRVRPSSRKDNVALFIATDDCVFTRTLLPLLPSYVTVHSRCMKEQSFVLTRRDVITPGYADTLQTLDVLVDIELLRRGVYFIGLEKSNFVRMVRFIRGYPRGVETFHALPVPNQDKKVIDDDDDDADDDAELTAFLPNKTIGRAVVNHRLGWLGLEKGKGVTRNRRRQFKRKGKGNRKRGRLGKQRT